MSKNGNKKRKIGLFLLLAVLILMGISAVIFLQWGQNSEAKKQYEKEIKEQVSAFTDQLLAKLDQVDPSDPESAELILDQENEETPGGAVSDDKAEKALKEEIAKQEDEAKRQATQVITAAYTGALQELRGEAISQLNGLMGQGKSEYLAMKGNGQNTAANKGALASEYIAKANALEGQIDGSFEALMSQMALQLEAEGIDPDPIVKEYRSEYHRIKESNRSMMLDKAMNAVN